MGEWAVALIAAGSALAGSVITGWFSRSAGVRQAEALLRTVGMTLEEQHVVRVLDLRRQTYVRFLDAVEAIISARVTGEGSPSDRPALQSAFTAVLLAGPAEVARTAQDLLKSLREESGKSLDDTEHARVKFIEASQGALSRPDRAPGE